MANENILDPDINFSPLNNINCNYHNDLDTLKQFIIEEPGLNVICANIRSARKNFDEFLATLNIINVNFHIIILCETWLKCEADWTPVIGYSAFHSVRPDRRGGGVTVLVSDVIESNAIPSLLINNELLEVCGVDLTFNKKVFTIVGIYRPPQSSLNEVNSALSDIFNNNNDYFSRQCIIAGDVNVDLGCDIQDDLQNDFLNVYYSNNFIPMINIPTRITNDSAKVIDHIWTNVSYSRSGVVVSGITDHYLTFIILPFPRYSNEYVYKSFRSHNPEKMQIFRDRTSDFVDSLMNLDDLGCNVVTELFCNGLFDIYNDVYPVKRKQVSFKRASRPWLTESLLKSIDKKHKLYREICSGCGDVNYYKRYRNSLTTIIRKAKESYFKNRFSNSVNDSKATWKLINSMLTCNRRKGNNVIKLRGDNAELIDDPKLVADEFNDYFSNVATNLDSQIPLTNTSPMSYVNSIQNSMLLFDTSEEEVLDLIRKFPNKGCHLNAIPSFIYKNVATIIAPLLCKLVNISFNEGIFPTILKIGRIIPIHKSGTKYNKCNYRPITTLHFVSKIFEKIMDRRVRQFFDKFNIISPNQFGFQRKLSTTDAILQFTDHAFNSLNSGRYLLAVFLDFSKAFDTVNIDILLNKLNFSGVRGRAWNWLRSYLTGREQYVEISGVRSESTVVRAGVPQGSTLGPLLFNLYINDMPSSAERLRFVHFADDTTVFMTDDDLPRLVSDVNSELAKLDLWLQTNRLSLNISKTNFMIFSNRSKELLLPIKIRNVDINCVNCVKFLGVFIDDRLSFNSHINCVLSKVSKNVGVLSRVRKCVPDNVLRSLYFSLIYPYLIYGCQVWSSGSISAIKKLQSTQNRCIRLFYSEHDFNIQSTFNRLNLMPLNKIHKYFILTKFFQYNYNSNYSYFHNKIQLLHFNHTYQTRLNDTNGVTLPGATRAKYCRSFLFQAAKLWNLLPPDLREPVSFNLYKVRLKHFIFNTLNF